MKNLFYSLITFAVIGLMVSCSKGLVDAPTINQVTNVEFLSTPIDPANLPAEIQAYITTNFPDATITEAEQHDNNGNITYEVHLDNGLELLFAPNGTLLAMGDDEDDNGVPGDNDDNGPDSDGTEISAADLPQAIIEYINTNYNGAVILFAELENDGSYEVYLDNGEELHFDANGQFLNNESDNDDDGISADNDDNGEDDNDDGDGDNDDGIADNDDDGGLDDNDDGDGDNDDGIADNDDEGTVDNDDNGEGDNDDDGGNGDGTSINPSELPQAALDYIAANYPDAQIVEAEIYADGTYEVKLDDGTELYFDADGNFIAEDSGSGEGTSIDPSELPQAALDYIAANYPDAQIVEAEVYPDGTYEVKLDDGTELYFDADGNLIP